MKRPNLQSVSVVCLIVLFASFNSGCGNSSARFQQSPPVQQPTSLSQVSISITPGSVRIKHDTSWKFSAEVTNASDATVSWSVQEGSVGGTITDDGVYTASVTDGTYHVVATSRADSTRSASAIVIVSDAVVTPTGNLTAARFFGHTATLLPNGQVFVAGGLGACCNYTVVDKAEQFDPATGTFQVGGDVARAFHSATMLANGDLLIVGGVVQWEPKAVPTDSGEILKAGTGELQPTGSLSAPRYWHTATLLQDGRVLIAGGFVLTATGLVQEEASAEIYDPATGTFTPAANMNKPRTFHTATLLPNGKVLIAGPDASAELYDPATNSFTLTGSMASNRSDATATLLPNGKVLIAGGALYYDEVYQGPAEIYDPATGQFTPTGQLVMPRWSHTATLLPDGTVLLAGGEVNEDDDATATTEIFHPDIGSFTGGPTMTQARAEHTATLLQDGSVLFVGGDGTGISAEIYK